MTVIRHKFVEGMDPNSVKEANLAIVRKYVKDEDLVKLLEKTIDSVASKTNRGEVISYAPGLYFDLALQIPRVLDHESLRSLCDTISHFKSKNDPHPVNPLFCGLMSLATNVHQEEKSKLCEIVKDKK